MGRIGVGERLSALVRCPKGNERAHYSAAFDTVEATVLNWKLAWASAPARKLLLDYIKGGTQRVKWNGTLSEVNEVLYGVRQGSALGPLL